ncbi:MAG TPA: SRPBCC family protein [Longimicrobiales bacterium]|nr:SRPBCC family protein [Longimicrobiales bacterium]
MATDTDRIEKHTLLRAPIERVWRAVSEAEQFGRWFGMHLDGPFVAGERVTGHIVPTTVDPGVAEKQKAFEGAPVELWVERIEPMRLFSFRWHPYAADPNVDVASEPTTLVEFRLEEAKGATHLTIVESGFDAIPLERREAAFRANEGGWTLQLTLIEKYVTDASR